VTKRQFRTAIAGFGLSQVKAAEWLDLSTRTAHNWATGVMPVPESVAKLFLLMQAMGLSPEDVDRLVEESRATNGKRGSRKSLHV
jgi:hypothetical protein